MSLATLPFRCPYLCNEIDLSIGDSVNYTITEFDELFKEVLQRGRYMDMILES
jgi:hypothetical protein